MPSLCILLPALHFIAFSLSGVHWILLPSPSLDFTAFFLPSPDYRSLDKIMASSRPCLSRFREFDVDELSFFVEEEVNERAADKIRDGHLDGVTFLLLEEADMKELFPVLGDRLHIKELLRYYKDQEKGAVSIIFFPKKYFAYRIMFPQVAVPKSQLQVPPRSSSWLENFHVDKVYSTKTMEFLSGTTSTLTKAIRAEIVGHLYYRVLQHTSRPTSGEYKAVCSALVAEFPSLTDCEEAPYVCISNSTSPNRECLN